VKFNVKTREITMECWPRNVDIFDPATKQYNGWPKTIRQEENYGRKAVAYLPTLQFEVSDPVVQVVDESNDEVVYALRIQGKQFRPKVFGQGKYTLTLEHEGKKKVLKGLKALSLEETKIVKIRF